MKIIFTFEFGLCGASLWAYYRVKWLCVAIVVEMVDTLDLKFGVI